MRFHGISRDFTRFHGISRDLMGFEEISWDLKRFRGISRDFIGFRGISWDFMIFHAGCKNVTHFSIVSNSWHLSHHTPIDMTIRTKYEIIALSL